MDFWDFAMARKLRPTVWGDYLRGITSGEIPRPPAVTRWQDAVAILNRQRFDVDRKEVRTTWYHYAYDQKQRQARATKPDNNKRDS